MINIKRRTWEIMEVTRPGDKLGRIFSVFFVSLIFLNVVAVIIGSVDAVQRSIGSALDIFEIFSVVVFTVEYLLRLWSCTSTASFGKPIWGRILYLFRPMSIIDLLAILPFYLPFVGVDLRFLRTLRLLRIIRLAKIGRYYSSTKIIRDVVFAKKDELLLTTFIMFVLLILSACIMYNCENEAQPEKFPNIPSTMWWSVVTLTTVGYGDICPVTPVGKFFGAIIAILGVGMFALPTGILGAGFVEAIAKKKSNIERCPHCGKEIEH